MTGSARECVWCWKCWFGYGGGRKRVAYVLDLSCCWLGQGGGRTAAAAAASTVASAVVVVAVAVAAVVAAVAIAAAVATAAVANTDAAVAAPLDPSFDSPTASVMASASACSSRSSSCSLLCIPMEPAWGIRAVSRMGGCRRGWYVVLTRCRAVCDSFSTGLGWSCHIAVTRLVRVGRSRTSCGLRAGVEMAA